MAQRGFDKRALVASIIRSLHLDLETYARSARAAHAEATDEQSKAENKYDTRGLEASYLARGQSQQAAEVIKAIERYETLNLRHFGPDDPIELGALVGLQREAARTLYFIGPSAGGMEAEHEGEMVMVITPQSPLGQQLVGHTQEERLEIKVGAHRDRYRIVAVA